MRTGDGGQPEQPCESSYIKDLAQDGALIQARVRRSLLDATTGPDASCLLFRRRQLAGSIIGGIRETQEMLDFCAAHGITADVEVIQIQKINEAYGRLAKSDVKYRFVVDMASLE